MVATGRDSSVKAVAVDLGASSARIALGELQADASGTHRISFRVTEQVAHEPIRSGELDHWDFGALEGLCQRALALAEDVGAASLSIDSWGVDIGFVNSEGDLVQSPVCYRDASHSLTFEKFRSDRTWLYEQTGIQHQPFNTLYQLLARRAENPALFEGDYQWLLLPDLLLSRLGAESGYEMSIASTTQLTDASGQWNEAVFDHYSLPQPNLPVTPGPTLAGIARGVHLIRGAGHDTAAAVTGMGHQHDSVFLNLGTWALMGKLAPFNNTDWAANQNLTNERLPDGRVRLLRNVPGFFVLNALRSEFNPETPMSDFLNQAEIRTDSRIDVFDPSLFSPPIMSAAISELAGSSLTPQEHAGIALLSLVDALSDQFLAFGGASLRLTGGGSQSPLICQLLANQIGKPVIVGPSEATLLGNLALQFQFLGAGRAEDLAQASQNCVEYRPSDVPLSRGIR